MYGSETMLWNEKETSRISSGQMDNFREFLGIRRMDRVPNAQIRELCRMKDGPDESMLWWFSHVERMDSNRIAKSLCRRVCW